jgi:hypothetical protein
VELGRVVGELAGWVEDSKGRGSLRLWLWRGEDQELRCIGRIWVG